MRADIQQRLKHLQEQHRKALEAGDIEGLEKVQVELAKLMDRPRASPPI
jgi:uncharacterized membrane protein (DUF106 family)